MNTANALNILLAVAITLPFAIILKEFVQIVVRAVGERLGFKESRN